MKMSIQDAMSYIHGTYKFGSKLGLENIKELLFRLGNPQKSLKFVHVAGTNGKGSTSSFIANVLIKSGYHVGLYTSPFIEVFNERMRIDGVYISDDELASLTSIVKDTIEGMLKDGCNHPTEFEVVTAIAMLYYSKHNCDIVVLEVGLGGRLDATNAIDLPLVSVITPLAMDHVEYLGNTIEKIAYEKAGIVKEGGYTVIHPQEQGAMNQITRICDELSNKLIIAQVEKARLNFTNLNGLNFDYDGNEYNLKMIAPYQMNNAVVAIEVIKLLRDIHGFAIGDLELVEGINSTQWLGRLEIIRNAPLTIIDGAHNVQGIEALANSIKKLWNDETITGIVGMLEDKDVKGMLDSIAPYINQVILTKPDNPRAMSAEDLANRFSEYPHIKCLYVNNSIENVVEYAEANKDDLGIMIYFGSLYMIGEVRKKIVKRDI